ncbi:SPOSA6832_01125 [Sporobolomyces salmonicolor]|uniref:SPOSA6832_01125-mRNA-1:cds n=1 Tax=Sporidiobolus salmonicolor TaxID=5005 RepID=A0A0D6EHS6_SPOSA|nr:SPOSA6832_01125 [Sporobolomyces salmonicolor]
MAPATKRKGPGDMVGVASISPDGISGLDDEMEVQLLGAGQEVRLVTPSPSPCRPHVQVTYFSLPVGVQVGRSCCVIKYKGRTIVCDAGVHPAFSGMAALPFLDELDWSTVDAILITHFHLDHAASLTYVMEKTNFKEGNGVVYMSHPTKAVYRYLMSDFVRVSTAGTDENLFTESEMLASFNQIQSFDFEQEILLPPSRNSDSTASVRFTSFAAGHVLGACMFLLEIAGARVLYTGDYSTEEDRHLVPAKVPNWERSPDVMICESTYGVQSHEPRLEKEAQFTSASSPFPPFPHPSASLSRPSTHPLTTPTDLVQSIVKRGGRVLLPVFALGRAQELLLILDEFWAEHPELQHVPIYYISSLAMKCMDVYRQYIHTMSPNIRSKFARGINPFDFKGKNSFIRPLDRGISKLNDRNPCVVMASPGFLTNGVSRELLEKWAPDPRNGLIITGYSVEGVMARTIMNEPTEILALNGGAKIPRRLCVPPSFAFLKATRALTHPPTRSVDYISFSAHVDYTQNSKFIDEVMPSHLILVHGEVNNMSRLRSALKTRFAERKNDVQIYTPRNVETVKLKFRGERMAKALGSLALTTPTPSTPLSGLLVSKDFSYTLLSPADLREFTGLSTSVILQRQRLVLSVSWDLVRWHLQGMYGKIVEGRDGEGTPTMRVMETVDVKLAHKHELAIEWVGGATNDMIADSVLAVVLGIESSPASVKQTSGGHSHHPHPHPYAEPASPPPSSKPLIAPTSPSTSADTAKPEEPDSFTDAAASLPSRLDRLIAFLDSYFGQVELIRPEDLPLCSPSPPASPTALPEAAAEALDTPPAPSEPAEKAEDEEKAQEKKERVVEERRVKRERERPGAPVVRVKLDEHFADVRVEDLTVTSDYTPLQRRVESVVQIAMAIVTPLSSIGDRSAMSLAGDLHRDKKRAEGTAGKEVETAA